MVWKCGSSTLLKDRYHATNKKVGFLVECFLLHMLPQDTHNMVYKGFGKSVEYWKPLKSPEFSVLKTLRLPLVASDFAHFL